VKFNDKYNANQRKNISGRKAAISRKSTAHLSAHFLYNGGPEEYEDPADYIRIGRSGRGIRAEVLG
jgi:hypothetical protein